MEKEGEDSKEEEHSLLYGNDDTLLSIQPQALTVKVMLVDRLRHGRGQVLQRLEW